MRTRICGKSRRLLTVRRSYGAAGSGRTPNGCLPRRSRKREEKVLEPDRTTAISFGQQSVSSFRFEPLARLGERFDLRGGEGRKGQIQALQRLDDQLGDDEARKPLVVGR